MIAILRSLLRSLPIFIDSKIDLLICKIINMNILTGNQYRVSSSQVTIKACGQLVNIAIISVNVIL